MGDLKVTDNRIFDANGELKEEFRHLEDTNVEPEAQEAVSPPEPSVPPATEAGLAAEAPARPAQAPSSPPPVSSNQSGVEFVDLVRSLAEPIALYLGDITLPDGTQMEDLERARLHIDLIQVLRDKTVGNLEAQESRMLDELIYSFQMRYVEKTSGD